MFYRLAPRGRTSRAFLEVATTNAATLQVGRDAPTSADQASTDTTSSTGSQTGESDYGEGGPGGSAGGNDLFAE